LETERLTATLRLAKATGIPVEKFASPDALAGLG